jgi:transcriptional/translational regulatory protein YebC/TACO1
MFNKKGIIVIERDENIDEDTLMMEAIEAGSEDFEAHEEYFEIITQPEQFSDVREYLEKKGYSFAEAEIEYVPVTTTKLTDEKQIELMEKLIDHLEDMDDVQNIYHNWQQD